MIRAPSPAQVRRLGSLRRTLAQENRGTTVHRKTVMNHRSTWLIASLSLSLLASCQASYSSTTKEETKADGTSTKETTTEAYGAVFPNGGTVQTDGTSVAVTVDGPNGPTTETPAPGEPVPVPAGSTSVETKETVKPVKCPHCGFVFNVRTAGGSGHGGRLDPAYHRFERYVPQGEWEGYLYAEDASALVSGESAAVSLWSQLVGNLAGGFSYAPSVPPALRDVRFYGMRMWAVSGQVYLSFADVNPFSSLSITLTEVGTTNTAMFDLSTPGTVQSSANGWYTADIPIDFVPTNVVDPRIELHPLIQNVGSMTTKGYVRTLAW